MEEHAGPTDCAMRRTCAASTAAVCVKVRAAVVVTVEKMLTLDTVVWPGGGEFTVAKETFESMVG
jgi:hypothetical protein